MMLFILRKKTFELNAKERHLELLFFAVDWCIRVQKKVSYTSSCKCPSVGMT